MQFLIISGQIYNIEKNLQGQQQCGQAGEVNKKTEPQDPQQKLIPVEQTNKAYIKSWKIYSGDAGQKEEIISRVLYPKEAYIYPG